MIVPVDYEAVKIFEKMLELFEAELVKLLDGKFLTQYERELLPEALHDALNNDALKDMYDGVEYQDPDDAAKIVCLTRNFYDITKGAWNSKWLLPA